MVAATTGLSVEAPPLPGGEEDEEDVFEQQSHARWSKAPDPDRPPPDAPPGLPSGKSLVEAVEKYLRQARGDDDPPGRGPAV